MDRDALLEAIWKIDGECIEQDRSIMARPNSDQVDSIHFDGILNTAVFSKASFGSRGSFDEFGTSTRSKEG